MRLSKCVYAYIRISIIRDASGGPEMLKDILSWKHEIPNIYQRVLTRGP